MIKILIKLLKGLIYEQRKENYFLDIDITYKDIKA